MQDASFSSGGNFASFIGSHQLEQNFTLVSPSECELFVKNPVQQIFTVLKNEFFYQSFSNFHCSFNLTSNFSKVDRIPWVQLQIVENNQNHG